ncbi:MAG: hypothetical protein HOP17_01635 [Acidobacteria bacterium]|nr:hypothetical protein [Acidobacteriota bacterium]
MDYETAFVELSALLTGLQDRLLNDPEDHELNKPFAKEYARRLHGTFPDKFQALLDAYKTLAGVNPKPAIDDALLTKLRNTPEFKDIDANGVAKETVARQIVNVWYFSQFMDESGESIDGGFYESGAVWSLIKAHPIGFSSQPHGYWAAKPE